VTLKLGFRPPRPRSGVLAPPLRVRCGTATRGYEADMGTLVVHRPDDWGGRIRRLKIFIDGAEVAGLRPNESHTAELPAGLHHVRGQMDWATCAPLPIEVPDGGTVHAEVSLPYTKVFRAFVTPKRAVQARLL
jgi:hypothetical protein